MIEVHSRSVTFLPPSGAAYLMGDFTDWDESPLPITGPMTLEFPQGAYIEYAFLDTNKQPLADPENHQMPKHPWYEYHRTFTLPLNRFVEPAQPHAFRGDITEQVMVSNVFACQRHYYVYEPPISPVATVYVHDGEAFYRKLRFHDVVEALIECHVIQPVRLVMIEPENRTTEYWFSERYETFLLKEMIPMIEQSYGKTAERGLWGASLGGLVSIWLAWRNPDIFSKVASQSGCFTAIPGGGDSYHDPEWLTEQLRQTPRRPLRLYVETGQIEWLLAPNRRFAAMLADKGYIHSYHERPSGHNWATWEQGLEPGLSYLFPTIE